MDAASRRLLQIHPTLACNLRCRHCYSESGPDQRGLLDPHLLSAAIEDAAAEGFDLAGFSGGEPLLYRPLPQVLDVAHANGMRTTVTTNGTLLDGPRLQRLADRVDLLAISLDGRPASHNRMRASSRSFERMEHGLELVRQAGIPFGIIFTLTRHNLDELCWAAQFALDHGAQLLHIHPLSLVGRAADGEADAVLGNGDSQRAFADARVIAALAGGNFRVQLDMLPRYVLLAHPPFSARGDAEIIDEPLSALVSPLVIKADGEVVPVQYGFSLRYGLGNLRHARLAQLAHRWRRERYRTFFALQRAVHCRLTAEDKLAFVDWYDVLERASHASDITAI